MDKKAIFERVKRATVGIVMPTPERLPKKPFTIIGSGFCVHPAGVVISCEHVFRAFFDQNAYKEIMKDIPDGPAVRPVPPGGVLGAPAAMFFTGITGANAVFPTIGVESATAKTNFDLAIFKLPASADFPDGYPTLPIAEYDDLHEMMEVGICGFPLGDSLYDQIGTVGSSFTTGRLSSILPLAGVSVEDCKGFQLDLTATNGNSGGPVFSLESGRVFGVLQRGVVHPQSMAVLQGLAKAEPVYAALQHDLIDRMARGEFKPPGAMSTPARG